MDSSFSANRWRLDLLTLLIKGFDEINLMKLNIRLLEFLTAYNSVVWVPLPIETGDVLMANNVPQLHLRAARISNGLLKL